ncbi:MAG: radical SAM protein [Candidatus Thorarchaeota archaeon]|nr:MAG: radical SAM protein [Candidatus Thorarchaeota archaeon]
MVEKVRLSIGTSVQLGLESGTRDLDFTTAFLMTYQDGKCEANCAFCPQARESSASSDRLSRISWPELSLDSVIENWPPPGQFRRICVQTICYSEVVSDVVDIVGKLRKVTKLPISVAIHPILKTELQTLKDVGVSNIGIALDACTAELFDEIKGEKRDSHYRWENHHQAIQDALTVFGKRNVTTHLIVGLGESEFEAAQFIAQMYQKEVSVGLFAFTNIKGTSLENHPTPDLESYRRIQAVRDLVSRAELKADQIKENSNGIITLMIDQSMVREALSSGEAFQVTGCKGCNRPFYNERPRGPMYNFPRRLTQKEIQQAIEETRLVR